MSIDEKCLDCGHPKNRHFSTFDGSSGSAWCEECRCQGYAFMTSDGLFYKDGAARPDAAKTQAAENPEVTCSDCGGTFLGYHGPCEGNE